MALDYEMIPGTAPPTLECEEDEESKVITGLMSRLAMIFFALCAS